MIHEEYDKEEGEQTYEARKGPFDFDQKTIWQRESDDYEKDHPHDKKVLQAILLWLHFIFLSKKNGYKVRSV